MKTLRCFSLVSRVSCALGGVSLLHRTAGLYSGQRSSHDPSSVSSPGEQRQRYQPGPHGAAAPEQLPHPAPPSLPGLPRDHLPGPASGQHQLLPPFLHIPASVQAPGPQPNASVLATSRRGPLHSLWRAASHQGLLWHQLRGVFI